MIRLLSFIVFSLHNIHLRNLAGQTAKKPRVELALQQLTRKGRRATQWKFPALRNTAGENPARPPDMNMSEQAQS